MVPGATQLVRMLSRGHSQARLLVSWLTAPLLAQYTDKPSTAMNAPMEEMKTMLPLPDALRRGCASWLRWKVDSKLVLITSL